MNTPAAPVVQCGAATLHLLPDPALWWPERRMLFIADLHLGKAATFRALGQPVPHGTTQANLARLSRLIERHPAETLVVLGDLLHAPEAHTASLLHTLALWRARHAGLRCVLVRGNHDQRAGDPPAALGIDVVDEPWALGPLAACHHPRTTATPAPSAPAPWVLAGHVHPTLVLRGRGRQRLRLPCFVLEAGQLLLPAFGEFTGGWHVPAQPGRVLFAVAPEGVWRLPDGAPAG